MLRAPPGHGPVCPAGQDLEAALACHAPILMQQTAPGAGGSWDIPTPLDADGSGTLRDDAAHAVRADAANGTVTWYVRAARDTARLYLFYGLYYPADWSGPAAHPELDHPGDVEGALVVVDAASGMVEAVVTQAHNLFYLWLPAPRARLPPAASGTVTVERGRPVLFSESGGHGLYAWGRGDWRPAGGRRYAGGPAAVPGDRVRRVEAVDLEPLEALEAFTDGPRGGFRDLPGGARPPWRWQDRRQWLGGGFGDIVLAPGAFYRRVLRAPRP